MSDYLRSGASQVLTQIIHDEFSDFFQELGVLEGCLAYR